jgi:hypothetical protein
MEHTNCPETELLIDEYLDGMIAAEDKKKMEEHLSGCLRCKNYLEETVLLLEKAALLSRSGGEDLLSKDKQKELWNKIEEGINASLPQKDSHIYNMSGLEDEYIAVKKTGVNRKTKDSLRPWGSLRYYASGIAAALILAFVIYGVNEFVKSQKSGGIVLTDNIVEVGGPKWMVTSLKGSPLINNMVMKAIDSIAIGGYVTTDDSSKAELYVAGLGSVIIEPGSKVKLIKSIEGEHRIQLDYGSIDANIFAKPRTFFVEAGSVTAVDLGCSYKYSVDKSGDGLLYVRSGKVSLESAGGRESIVPEGKFCVTRQEFGPGTPFRNDSSPLLKKALMEFDFGSCGGECVNAIIKNAKKTDAVTLVNIMPRVNEEQRTRVYDRVAFFYPAPKNIPVDSIPKLKNLESLNEWVDEIMVEVQKNIQESMQRVEENMKQFDDEKWQKDWEKSVKKDWNFSFDYNYQPGNDSMIMFNDENMPSPEEIEDLNEELKEMQKDLHFNNEDFKKEMEKVKEDLKRVNEQIKQDMEEVKKEVEKEKRSTNKEDIDKEKTKIHKDKNSNEKDSGDDEDN